MPTTAPTRAAIYIKETAGYPDRRELQGTSNLRVRAVLPCRRIQDHHPLPRPAGRQAPVRLDDGRGHRRRTTVRRHHRVQAQELLLVPRRDRALPSQAESQRHQPPIHRGNLHVEKQPSPPATPNSKAARSLQGGAPSMEKKLGPVSLEQLGQLPTYPNRPRRTPEPIPEGGGPSPRFHQPTVRPSTSGTSQPTRTRSRNFKMIYGAAASTARNRHSRSSSSTPIPREAGRKFRQMMTVATGRRPPFDNIMVSNINSRFAPYPAYNMDCYASTSGRTASPSGQCHQVCKAGRRDVRLFENCRHCRRSDNASPRPRPLHPRRARRLNPTWKVTAPCHR